MNLVFIIYVMKNCWYPEDIFHTNSQQASTVFVSQNKIE